MNTMKLNMTTYPEPKPVAVDEDEEDDDEFCEKHWGMATESAHQPTRTRRI